MENPVPESFRVQNELVEEQTTGTTRLNEDEQLQGYCSLPILEQVEPVPPTPLAIEEQADNASLGHILPLFHHFVDKYKKDHKNLNIKKLLIGALIASAGVIALITCTAVGLTSNSSQLNFASYYYKLVQSWVIAAVGGLFLTTAQPARLATVVIAAAALIAVGSVVTTTLDQAKDWCSDDEDDKPATKFINLTGKPRQDSDCKKYIIHGVNAIAVHYGRSCYVFESIYSWTGHARNFRDAMGKCNSKGGRLAWLLNEAIVNAVCQAVEEDPKAEIENSVYIGLMQSSNETSVTSGWFWVQPPSMGPNQTMNMDTTAWVGGEPNDNGKTDVEDNEENYAALEITGHALTDVHDFDTSYICEYLLG